MLVASGFGLGAVLRRRRRRSHDELGPDPAAELRAKLAESKDPAGEEPGPAQPADESGEAALDPQSRRQDVHDRARQAIDELR